MTLHFASDLACDSIDELEQLLANQAVNTPSLEDIEEPRRMLRILQLWHQPVWLQALGLLGDPLGWSDDLNHRTIELVQRLGTFAQSIFYLQSRERIISEELPFVYSSHAVYRRDFQQTVSAGEGRTYEETVQALLILRLSAICVTNVDRTSMRLGCLTALTATAHTIKQSWPHMPVGWSTWSRVLQLHEEQLLWTQYKRLKAFLSQHDLVSARALQRELLLSLGDIAGEVRFAAAYIEILESDLKGAASSLEEARRLFLIMGTSWDAAITLQEWLWLCDVLLYSLDGASQLIKKLRQPVFPESLIEAFR